MECPRCDADLGASANPDHPVHPCRGCAGLLLGRRALEDLFTQLSEGIPNDDAPPRKVADPGGQLFCPSCARPMQNYGYLGASWVMIDRCGTCDLMWIDRGELEAMRTQWAKSRAGIRRRLHR